MSGSDQVEQQAALSRVLADNPYPGRGIVCARTLDGVVVGCYFVTGRSAASREREIRHTPAGELTVAAKQDVGFDPLRHYVAVTASPEWLVLGNGAQVSTVAERLAQGQPPAVALDELEHEPDDPIFTDRITAVMRRPFGQMPVLGVARRSTVGRPSSGILTMTVRDMEPGNALLLTTYFSDGQVINGGRPFIEACTRADDGAALLDEVWASLNPAYRVAALVLPVGAMPADALIRNS